MAESKPDERQLYNRVVQVFKDIDGVLADARSLEITIESCLFVGKLSAAGDVLMALVQAGVPVHGPHEKKHKLVEEDQSVGGGG